MAALDTNVLVRFLVKDDLKRANEIEKLIAQSTGVEASIFLSISVILETERVLRSVYKFPKEHIVEVFAGLLETRELVFQDEPTIERTLFLYRQHNVDFADCLHLATAFTHDHLPLISFDRQAARMEGIEIIS